jgi:hypothetical protein
MISQWRFTRRILPLFSSTLQRLNRMPGPLHRIALESFLIGGRQMLVKHHINANERS